MCASRRRACSYSSRMSTADPSPITNPSRVASNGREACSGSSLRELVARMASKQAIEIGVIGASLAPATTMSATSSWISWYACPIASMPEVQPVETTEAGPCAPYRQATSAAKVLGIHAW